MLFQGGWMAPSFKGHPLSLNPLFVPRDDQAADLPIGTHCKPRRVSGGSVTDLQTCILELLGYRLTLGLVWRIIIESQIHLGE